MRITPSTTIATRVDPETATRFREAMARVGSTPSEALRIMIGAALAGPQIPQATAPAPAPDMRAAA